MVNQDEKLQDYLAKNAIKLQFNLSRAPWWAVRKVGWFSKSIGHGQLSWKEFEAVLLSVETNPEAPESEAKPKRDAAKAATALRIKDIVQEDNVDI
jgi:hypothetical protein